MNKKNNLLIIMGVIISFVMIIVLAWLLTSAIIENKVKVVDTSKTDISAIQQQTTAKIESVNYTPQINPQDFSSDLTNKYFNMPIGKKLIYEGMTEDGLERIEVYSMDKTKTVMGVETRVIWDRVWLNDELIEDTYDWYAQDKDGNVWYFGEDTAEMIDGKIINHNGAWEAGIDGALPGIIQPANPEIGKTYQTEYYKGKAEDRIDILALDETVTVPYKTLSNCQKTKDYTPLDSGVFENKYDCPEVGFVVLEIAVENGERIELISVDYNAQPSPSVVTREPENLVTKITEDEAKTIALKEISGEVTDIAIERKAGKVVFVVEIDADNGPETDVLIDIETGEILGVEN
jgi:uncharacterized membrane protein YkoI